MLTKIMAIYNRIVQNTDNQISSAMATNSNTSHTYCRVCGLHDWATNFCKTWTQRT